MVAGAVIGFFMLILGMKNRKIDKLESENKVKEVQIKTIETAKGVESEHAQKLSEVKNETAKATENIATGKTSYNDVVKGWNEGS